MPHICLRPVELLSHTALIPSVSAADSLSRPGAETFVCVFSLVAMGGANKAEREESSSAPPSYIIIFTPCLRLGPEFRIPEPDVGYLNELMQRPLFSPQTRPCAELFRPVTSQRYSLCGFFRTHYG